MTYRAVEGANHEDLNSGSPNTQMKSWVQGHMSIVPPSSGKWRQADPWGSLAMQYSLMDELSLPYESLSQKIRWKERKLLDINL